jgi:hypothetical protein
MGLFEEDTSRGQSELLAVWLRHAGLATDSCCVIVIAADLGG